MRVTVTKLTDVDLAQRACQFTNHDHAPAKSGLEKLYRSEHSPIRTQLFWIEMKHIPSFVSVHFVRHHVGVEHFVQTHRKDRGATETSNRETPVHHAMLCNAQSLINMSRKRLCFNASDETRQAMVAIKDVIRTLDPALADHMVADCVYRGKCVEPKGCGLYDVEGRMYPSLSD